MKFAKKKKKKKIKYPEETPVKATSISLSSVW